MLDISEELSLSGIPRKIVSVPMGIGHAIGVYLGQKGERREPDRFCICSDRSGMTTGQWKHLIDGQTGIVAHGRWATGACQTEPYFLIQSVELDRDAP